MKYFIATDIDRDSLIPNSIKHIKHGFVPKVIKIMHFSKPYIQSLKTSIKHFKNTFLNMRFSTNYLDCVTFDNFETFHKL